MHASKLLISMNDALDWKDAKSMTNQLPAIHTAHLFSPLDDRLNELLANLSDEEWQAKTIVPKWTVKEVAAHLLDTAIRRLSIGRDGYFPDAPQIKSNEDLIRFVNQRNREGVEFFRRLSGPILTSMMIDVTQQLSAYVQQLDPNDEAKIGVSWAGEERSLNWFDIAREFIERWHHQQQIRIALDKPGILVREFYYPVIDCFMRSLPFTYHNVEATDGSILKIEVSGDCGGEWYLQRTANAWTLVLSAEGSVTAETTIPQDIAWRLFTKGFSREQAERVVTFAGDQRVARHLLNAIAIVG